MSACLALLTTFIFYLILPFLLVYMLIIFLKMKCISALARYRFGVSQLCDHVAESFFTSLQLTIFFQLSVDGKLSPEKVTELLEALLSKTDSKGNLIYEKFRQKISYHYGYPFWTRETSLTLADHISVYKNGKVQNSSNKHAWEKEICSKELNPKNSSPWEITLVNMWDRTEDQLRRVKTTLNFRVHHMLGDGHMMFYMLMGLLDNPEKLMMPKLIRHKTTGSCWKHVQAEITALFTFIQTSANLTSVGLEWPWPLIATGQKVSAVSNLISLADLKMVAKKARVGVTTVILASIAQGIVHTNLKNYKTFPPSRIQMGIGVQFTNRKETDTKLMIPPRLCVVVPLEESKLTLANVSNMLLDAIFQMTPPGFHQLLNLFMNLMRPDWGPSCKATLTIVNFPGPQTQMSCAGIPVQDMFVRMEATGGNFLFLISILSYNGNVRFCVHADKCVIDSEDEAQQLLGNIEAQIYHFRDEPSSMSCIVVVES